MTFQCDHCGKYHCVAKVTICLACKRCVIELEAGLKRIREVAVDARYHTDESEMAAAALETIIERADECLKK